MAPTSTSNRHLITTRPYGFNQAADDLAHIDWSGRCVTIMGLGRHGGGIGAVRYLARRGALVTVSDMAEPQALARSLLQLGEANITACHFGGHNEADFRATEFVVVNPAIRPGHPCLLLAQEHGARLISEIELFLACSPAHVIGVTGSNGKSTTSAMLALMLSTGGRRAWLGGNIGGSLLDDVDTMTTDDWAVLELSSFQLTHLSPTARLPRLALVTGCTENHVDWHGSFEAYQRAKQRLVAEQSSDSVAVLNALDAEAASWRPLAAGRVLNSWPLDRIPVLRVPGAHNRQNAACAAAMAQAAGVEDAAIVDALQDFPGLPHRLQFLAELAGRRFYNDSKSTTPQATLAALDAVEGPLWLLAGGQSKGASFDSLTAAVANRARGACLFGAAREPLRACIASKSLTCRLSSCEQLADAFDWCWRQSQAGDAIVLSPACASLDQFRDFVERGEMFCALVRALDAKR